MFRRNRTTTADSDETQFCESCAQVCTPACRARAYRDGARTGAAGMRSGLPF
jgi:hypothetical protein